MGQRGDLRGMKECWREEERDNRGCGAICGWWRCRAICEGCGSVLA